jgi:serine/threonine-protein kinase
MALRMATSLLDSKPSLVGAILSRRFRLTRKLGEGGMGEVYAAESLDGTSRVAIKILKREFAAELDVLARFHEEGRTCMRLVHPNVVRVLECAVAEDGSPYLVMELLEGVPLSAYMQHGARVHIAQAAPILAGILSALVAAHGQGIVHRDLKPDNVFLTRDPSGAFVVKVLDFGIAKVMDAAGGMGNRTRTGMLLGTPAYMSPEQARSARDVDQRADLWSAGVLFYEMLTGRVAFPAPTEYARLAAVLSVEPESIDRCDSSLAPLAPFFARALKKNRDERFASAAEMLQALVAAAPVPADLGGGEGSRGIALSRLPDVHSVLVAAPQRPSPPTPVSTSAPPPKGSVPPRAAPTRVSPSLEPATANAGASGGTLASPAAPVHVESVPQVLVVGPAAASPFTGTLPSTDGEKKRRKKGDSAGLPLILVVVLVVFALGAGFLCGWVVGRTT